MSTILWRKENVERKECMEKPYGNQYFVNLLLKIKHDSNKFEQMHPEWIDSAPSISQKLLNKPSSKYRRLSCKLLEAMLISLVAHQN